MSDSETSANNNINYKTKHGENILDYKKTLTTDTDFHFNMIANQNKVLMDDHSNTSSEASPQKRHSPSPSPSPQRRKSPSPERRKSPSPERRKSQSPLHKDNYKTTETDTQYNNIPGRYSEEIPAGQVTQMSPQEIRMKKIELLRRLSEIKTKGYSLSKEYDFNSSIDEMQYEYDLLKSFAEKRNGIKIYKNILLNVTSAIEFVNDKYDPFDFHLSGWSEHLAYDIDSYDEVLEDLYEKYKGSGKKMPPEIKLLLLIVASASAFHFTKSQTLPVSQSQASSILNGVLNGKKEQSQFMTEQEINLERIRNELKNKQQQQQQPQQYQQQQPQQPQQQQQQYQQRQFNQSEPVASNAKPRMPSPRPNIPSIKAPENVKDILNRIHNLQPSGVKTKLNNNTDTQEESATNDRLLSESTLSDSVKRKSKTKSNISIM
jgi:hypothetical protein